MGVMDIIIKTIPHNQQRYETVGDWYFSQDHSKLFIFVSYMGNTHYEFLVAFHEQAEAMLCWDRGINEGAITVFDKLFEQNREAGNEDEPGDDPLAPYRKEHFFATTVERLMAAELNVDWEKYDKAIYAL
jgi:hypothetical protein